ncbi:hypothetical protein B0H11DRAFT_1912971 [Mycena galericulata]|nr:hypothetical protein B0H11DRAFT_1912971 [Mycena galericulata]
MGLLHNHSSSLPFSLANDDDMVLWFWHGRASSDAHQYALFPENRPWAKLSFQIPGKLPTSRSSQPRSTANEVIGVSKSGDIFPENSLKFVDESSFVDQYSQPFASEPLTPPDVTETLKTSHVAETLKPRISCLWSRSAQSELAYQQQSFKLKTQDVDEFPP